MNPMVCVDLVSCVGLGVSVALEQDVFLIGGSLFFRLCRSFSSSFFSFLAFSMAANFIMASLKGFSLSISGDVEPSAHVLLLLTNPEIPPVDSMNMLCTNLRDASDLSRFFLNVTFCCSSSSSLLIGFSFFSSSTLAKGGGLSHTELDDDSHELTEDSHELLDELELTPLEDGVRLNGNPAESVESFLCRACLLLVMVFAFASMDFTGLAMDRLSGVPFGFAALNL